MKSVLYHPDAAQEASDAALYYSAIRLKLGTEFQSELEAAIARVQDNPLLYPAESKDIRIAPLRRFPYSILYENLPEHIWIAAIAHHSRRPKYWAQRQP